MTLFNSGACPIDGQKDRAYLSADQAVDANATVTVALDSQSFGSNLTNNKIKVDSDGYYICRWKLSGANFDVNLKVNTTTIDDSQKGAEILQLNANDEVWLEATDTSGVANTINGGEYSTFITLVKLA